MEENIEMTENVVEEIVDNTMQEIVENPEEQITNEFTIGEESCLNLYTASKWCKFLSILGFVELAFVIIAGLVLLAGANMLADSSSPAIVFKVIGLLYLVIAVVCFFPISYMLRMAKKTQEAMELDDQEAIDEAFRYHRKFWKFLGIFTICSIALSILALPIIIIAAAA